MYVWEHAKVLLKKFKQKLSDKNTLSSVQILKVKLK